jgi:hypothetical protein
VDRLDAGTQRRLDQALLHEVALGGGAGADQIRLVGALHVHRGAVRLGVDADRADAELAERAEHAHGDLPAVRHQHLRERSHGGLF